MDNFSAREDNYLICESGFSASILKNRYRKVSEEDFFERLNILSLDSFIREEVILYWSLFFDGLRPNIIKRDSSIFILQKIIEDRRLFDGYFKDLNTDNISLARKVYTIMEKSSRCEIPVDAISHRMYRFKRGKRNKQIFDDMKNIIVEYRSVLSKKNLIDMGMIIEIYLGRFLKNEDYLHRLELKNIFIEEARFKNGEFSRYVNKVFKNNKLNYIKNETRIKNKYETKEKNQIHGKIKQDKIRVELDGINDKIEGDNENRVSLELVRYSDMISKLGDIISELVLEKRVSTQDICVIVPRYDVVLDSKFSEVFGRTGINIKMAASNQNIKKSEALISCISGIAIKKDFSYILKDEEKITFLRSVFKDKSVLDLIKNMEKYLRQCRESFYDIEESVKDYSEKGCLDEKKDSEGNHKEEYSGEKNLDKKYFDEEFIKVFFKRNFKHSENDIRAISRLCDIISEIKTFRDDIDDDVLKFLKDYVSISLSSNRKLEIMDTVDVAVFNLEDFLGAGRFYDYTIIFDASSKYYDYSCESEIETELAYMGDEFLSNIDDENISDIVYEMEEDEMKKRIKNLEDISFILHSDLGVNGYEQDNRFYHLLEEI